MSETCWIYAAVSSTRQEGTVEDQLAWGRGVANEHGWPVTKEFSDVATGKDGTREILETLLAELKITPKRERPERVLMIRLDRMGRGTGLDVIGAFGQIYKLGVIIHTRTDGDIPLDDPMQALKPIFDIWGGAKENRDRSDKSKAMHARKKAAGQKTGVAPYGTLLENGQFLPYEPEAAIIRDMFRLRVEGWGYSRLMRYLAPRAPAKKTPTHMRPLSWAQSTIHVMLKNPVYRGLVVDELLFDRAQLRRTGRPLAPRIARHPWPLQGAIQCVCGRTTVTRLCGAKGYRSGYYMCSNVVLHHGYKSHRADNLERQFQGLLERLQAHPDLIHAYAPPPDAIEGMEAQREALIKERATLETRKKRVWSLFEAGTVDQSEIHARLDELKEHERALSATIAQIDESLRSARNVTELRRDAAALIQTLPVLWPNADVQTRQQIARAVADVVGGLWVDPDNRNQLIVGIDRVANVDFSLEERRLATIERLLSISGTTRASTLE